MCSKQKSLTFGQYIPNDKVLNKKVPENPKYKHVKSAIDTGKNVRKHIDDLKEKQKNCNHKKDEVFKRIKFSTFIQLALAVASDLVNNETNSVRSEDRSSETQKTNNRQINKGVISNVLVGIGELDLIKEKEKINPPAMKPKKQMPYLLLDVRDKDAFAQCHIITAKNYPSAMLSRSTGYETEDLKLFKNYPHNVIILYDEDETVAVRVATTLVQRGYENVYLLSGGLKFALEVCPKGLTTSSQRAPSVHMVAESSSSNMHKTTTKEYFCQEDIETIHNYIDSFRIKGSRSAWSCPFSQSSRSKSVAASHRTGSTIDDRSTSSRASSTSQRPSTCNSYSTEHTHHIPSASSRSSRPASNSSQSTFLKNTEQAHIRTTTVPDRPKNTKKAPWK